MKVRSSVKPICEHCKVVKRAGRHSHHLQAQSQAQAAARLIMARIAGVDLPREKRVEIALTYIFGIGRPTSSRILGETGVSPDTRVRDLSDAEVARLRQMIERSVKVEGALRTEVAMNIKRLMDIGSYRGHPPPPGPAGARPAHPHQRADQEGSASGHRRQEESDQEVNDRSYDSSRCTRPRPRPPRRPGPSAPRRSSSPRASPTSRRRSTTC